jgi:hypothetical protein
MRLNNSALLLLEYFLENDEKLYKNTPNRPHLPSDR